MDHIRRVPLPPPGKGRSQPGQADTSAPAGPGSMGKALQIPDVLPFGAGGPMRLL
ncbi:hypothetical protein CALCODRAFT_498814, partial [Calocera cornea HHB12733]